MSFSRLEIIIAHMLQIPHGRPFCLTEEKQGKASMYSSTPRNMTLLAFLCRGKAGTTAEDSGEVCALLPPHSRPHVVH